MKPTPARIATIVLTSAFLALVSSSCSNDPAASDGRGNVFVRGAGGDACATPNEGCPCDAPNFVVPCGTVSHVGPDGYVACQMGNRTCRGRTWGACVGEGDVRTASFVLGGGLATQSGSMAPLALGATAACPTSGPNASSCDPYCNQFIDDSSGLSVDGGTMATEAGLTIDPSAPGIDGSADASSGSSGGYAAPAGGISGCAPTNRNVVGPACTPPGLTTCQQDFRCDPTTNQCLWNGGPGYRDASLGGIDLTVGVPCGPSGSAVSTAPVCNRGSAPVPAGSPIRFHQTNGASPPNGCTDLGPPTFSFTLGAALEPGQCTTFTLSNSAGAKFITLNAGVPGSQPIAEAAGRCANNSAYWKTDANDCALCNNACSTRLTGSIFDPRGVNELPGVLVYVPSTTPAALPADGTPACDTCASLVSGNPFSQAITAFDGSFTIDVPPGGSFPLVIQTGRWRRIVTVPAVPACTTATLSTSLSRLPKNKTEGNIPKMALTMSAGDQLECLLRKIGLDDAEFTAAGGTGRVHLYTHNGMSFAGATDGPTNLWGNAANLSSYSAIIAPCDNNHGTYSSPAGPNTTSPPDPTATASQRANVKAFLDGGGRLFTTHWMSHDFVHLNWPAPGGPAAGEFGTNVDNDREAPAFPYTIDTTTPTGALFSQWGNFIGASTAGPPSTISFSSWRHLSKTVNTASGATRLTYGDSTQAPVSHPQNGSQWGGPHVNMYQFETPWGGAPAGPQCGRVSVSQSHVQAGAGTFPGGCGSATTALTPQQKAFEFLLFSSQACLGAPPPPPTPPPPPPLPTVTFTRDYQGTCTPGFYPKWQPFYWRASVPAGTSIGFAAATGATQAALPATSTSPEVHAIGTATKNVTSPAWDCDGCPGAPVSVDYNLRSDPSVPIAPSPSRSWLRVFVTFTPNNAASPPVAPVLTSWRQVYSCIPAE